MNNKIIKSYIELKKSQQSLLSKTAGKIAENSYQLTEQEKQNSLELYSTEVICELYTVLLEVKNAIQNQNTLLDISLAITQDKNLKSAENFLHSNVRLVRTNITDSLKNILTLKDLANSDLLANSTTKDFMFPIYNALYKHYCNESKTTHQEDLGVDDLNKYLRMLLQAKISGLYGKNLFLSLV